MYKPQGYWKDMANQRLFFDQLAHKLNIQKPEDWAAVSSKTILDEGGAFVNRYYKSSVVNGTKAGTLLTHSLALQAIYPEHSEVWKDYRHRGHFDDMKHQRQFFDKLAIKLNIEKPEDWYNIQAKTVLNQDGGSFLLNRYRGSLIKGTSKRISIIYNYSASGSIS
jgi:hypothetical protein